MAQPEPQPWRREEVAAQARALEAVEVVQPPALEVAVAEELQPEPVPASPAEAAP